MRNLFLSFFPSSFVPYNPTVPCHFCTCLINLGRDVRSEFVQSCSLLKHFPRPSSPARSGTQTVFPARVLGTHTTCPRTYPLHQTSSPEEPPPLAPRAEPPQRPASFRPPSSQPPPKPATCASKPLCQPVPGQYHNTLASIRLLGRTDSRRYSRRYPPAPRTVCPFRRRKLLGLG